MKMILSTSTIVLKIHVVHDGVTKSIPLDMNAPIYAVCEHIRSVIREAEPETGKESKDYGLFLPHEMSKNGLWLDNMKNLVQYILKPGDVLEYRYRFRWLTIKTQDDIRKTLLVDDSWTVAELMILLCAKMGIINHEEYSLIKNSSSPDPNRATTNTKIFSAEKEQDKLEKLKKKLQTDDDLNWLNPSQTLRQQSVDEQEVLLLQRKYFFSDMNIDTRDPIQLTLLFIQSKEAILNGKHPVSMLESEQLAALQCQAEFGDTNTQKNKLTKLSLKDCLPKDYIKNKGIEKRIAKLYAGLCGKDNIEAKREYCSLCRSLKTYGITFFLVKEKIKGKSKLIPRLLGVSRDRVLRLDEKTKEILKTWPLTSIRRWAGSFNAFTMDFGEYAPNEYYTAQTNKGEQISQLISGYVDIIIKHQKTQEPQNADGFEESSVAEMKIEPNQAEIVEHRSSFTAKSLEDISRDIRIAITTPTEDLTHPISGTDSSQIDVTCVTSIRQSTDEHTHKSDLDDFDNVKLSNTPTMNLDVTRHNFHVQTNQKPISGKTIEGRELESAMSYGTSRSVQNYFSYSRNTLNSPETVRALNHSPDSFMTGGTRICHTIRRLNVKQQSLLQNININLEKLQNSKLLLDEKIDPKTIGHFDKENGRQNIKVLSKEHAIYNLGSMNTEVVQVLRSSKHAPLNANIPEETRENNAKHLKDIEKSFKIITVHFPSFVDNVRMISEMNSSTIDDVTEIKNTDAEDELTEDSPETLIDAARKLADAFSGMLNAVKPQEERDLDFRKAILDAANKVGEASSHLFRQITSSDRSLGASNDNCSRLGRLLQNSDHDYEDSLIYLMRAVANATAHLVQAVKTVTQNENASAVLVGCQKLIGPVTLAGLATSQLVTCVKILAPTINQANCTNQILAEIEEVRCTVDNVFTVSSAILSNYRSQSDSSQSNIAFLNDVEEAIMNVRQALDNLEEHLRCGITVVNFAPRIQSLELFLTEYDKLKRFFVTNSSSFRKINQQEEISETLSSFLLVAGKINEEITFLCDPEQGQNDPILASQKNFSSSLVKILEINKNFIANNPEKWKDLHYEVDNLVMGLLYEPGTRFISHDQLIHNLYRSSQILITCCHKLITSYRQVVLDEKIVADCREVVDRSEYILLIMNNLKLDPTNDKILASFIRESEKLAQSCLVFCRSIHNIIPNTSDDIIIDIMAVAASQTLAECEHMEETVICVKPIRAHLEMSAVAKMLNEEKPEALQKVFSHLNAPKLTLSQLFQISIAMLEKTRSNVQQTLPRAHFSTMFEMYNIENAEPSLIINLYHHLVKMNDIIETEAQHELQNRFKNVFLLMYRLVMLADNMLTSYGQHSGNHYPVIKCIDEILSTVYSLQSRSGNIFDKFKSSILNKQNIFRSKRAVDVTRSNTDSLQPLEFYLEKTTGMTKALIESALMCRQNFSNPKLLDNLQQLYQAFEEIATCTEAIVTLTGDSRIIDDFIILSLSLLNFVLEIENSLNAPEDPLSTNRISNKFRTVTESATRLQQTLSQTSRTHRGKFNEIIVKLQDMKKKIENNNSNYSLKWDNGAFVKILNEFSVIKSNSEGINERIDDNNSLGFENQLMAISEAIYEICESVCDKFKPFEERNQVISRSIDLSTNMIDASLNISKNIDLINNNKKISFVMKDLNDNILYLINCLREQFPGYKESSSALAIVAQLSHDINEIEFSIASENENVNYTQNVDDENKKKCASWLGKLANSVFNIHTTLESQVIADENLPGYIEDFANCLSELMSLIIHFAKKKSLTSEIKSYVGYGNELVDKADRYLRDVKQYFENIGTGIIIHTDMTMKDLMNEIISFLQQFDQLLSQNIQSRLNSKNQSLEVAQFDQNPDLANTMSGMITDDDTTILFASAGIKNSDFEKFHNTLVGQFLLNGEQKSVIPFKKESQTNLSSGFRDLIHKTAEALVHDTQTLVQNSGEKQKTLATNTESVILTISNFADECENGIINEPRNRSEAKMMNKIQSVRSALDKTYNDGSTEVSRLIVSNSPSLLKQENNQSKLPIADIHSIEETIINIQNRLDKFTDRITLQMRQPIQRNCDSLHTRIDSAMEKLVNHASSVLALSSELMRMPLQKLFHSVDQSRTIVSNISSQCQATLFDYLDSLEELGLCITTEKINQKIVVLGKNLSIQFIKLFQILQKTQKDPENKFIKSSMLDVFYEMQNGIKVLLDFSEEVQKSFDSQLSSPRKVSFREKSPLDQRHIEPRRVTEISNHDSLSTTKEKISHLNRILSDLSYPNQNLVSSEDSVILKSFINLIIKFTQISTDLIGLSKHCRELEHTREAESNICNLTNREIANYFERITTAIRTCVYGKNRNLEDQFEHIKCMVKEIAFKSADLLAFYQKQVTKSSWHQLLQTIAVDLRNISKEILNFNDSHNIQVKASPGQTFSYMSISTKSSKLTNE